MYTVIYFSPTGNTKLIAEKLGEELNINKSEILPLEFTNPKSLGNNNHMVLMYSIHGFNPPRTVKRFVKELPRDLYKYVSIIAVGCNTGWVNQAVSIDLKKQFIEKGCTIIVDEVLAMPLTFVMSFPDEVVTDTIEKTEKKLLGICTDLSLGIVTNREIPFKSKGIHFVGKAESNAARAFGLELHANKKCISCGKCWENCPENNIKPNKLLKPKFGFKCLMCMRCIYNCPQKAISPRISKFIPIKEGYSVRKI